MARLYLDTSVIIRLVESARERIEPLARRLEGTRSGADLAVVSELGRFECLVKPRREANDDLRTAFERFFEAQGVVLLPLDRTVFDRAIDIRARDRFSTPDALHLAAALVGGCDAFLTGDRELVRFEGIRVEMI